MKVWALNLPQFYETPENNDWWGKGFTEWTSVQKAKPLYRGHEQPLVPLNNNYYDLSEVKNIKWQADLAQKYGVEAFVYYHYWYEGRHLLEKPCEILLKTPEINMNYCFCWANHSWTRAWDGKNHQILVEQKYGGKEEWDAHLEYLMPFFKDKRYIKIDNKPVLFIYKAKDIVDGEERVNYWNECLKKEGFSGIYIIEYLSSFNPSPSLCNSAAVFEDEPNFSCRFEINLLNKIKRGICKTLKVTDYQNYDYLWSLILKKSHTYGDRKIVLGGFPRWDNSPRKGRNSRVIKGATPEKFKEYLKYMAEKKRENSLGVVLLNAWNEWGEGAILEPTELDGYGYLEAIKEVLHNDKE